MTLRDSSEDLRWKTAGYRVRLFLSADLCGSTAFKQSSLGQKSKDRFEPFWVTHFNKFYRSFPSRFEGAFTSELPNGMKKREAPKLWKAIGDELIFCSTVTSKEEIKIALNTFIKTLHEYRDELHSSQLNGILDIKGAAWVAAFPIPNLTVKIGSDSDSAITFSEKIESDADADPFSFDFLGKGIDTGFRVCSNATKESFALSVQLADLLLNLPQGSGLPRTIYLERPRVLKGVTGNIPYPTLYIDTLDHNPFADIRKSERGLFGEMVISKSGDITDYLRKFMAVTDIDEICLPDKDGETAPAPPESYTKVRAIIQEQIDVERLRDDKNQGPTDPDSDTN